MASFSLSITVWIIAASLLEIKLTIIILLWWYVATNRDKSATIRGHTKPI